MRSNDTSACGPLLLVSFILVVLVRADWTDTSWHTSPEKFTVKAGDTMVSQPPAQLKPVWRNGKFSFAEPEEVPARVEEVPEAPMFHPI